MLIVENITKKFPGVVALDNVSLDIQPGIVTAIIGENGAGKSTLMKILSGVYKDYEGRIILKGQQVNFSNTKNSQEKGIAIIHQELNLIPHQTITENIFLGRELVNSWGLLDKKAMRIKTKALLDKLKLNIDPETPIAELKVGQQQVVEIAKALLVDSDIIIMDEPTSAISEAEVEVLFRIINDLKKENKAIIYISHKLDELFKIADRYIVLRDGKMIQAGEMKGMTHASIIQKMVGREINIIRKKEIETCKSTLFAFESNEISFSVKRGEIVGLFGLMGAGRTELLESIFGMHHKRTSGKVTIDEKICSFKSPTEAINAGIALVPEDRKKDGLIAGLDIRKNICLTTLGNLHRAGILDAKKESALAEKYIDHLKIKTTSDQQLAKNLSGGNQQKIVLAKWLATHPKVLMLDEPTRGIDINAKNEIYKLILQLADEGLGIIVASSELPEILAISDRILVMAEGRLTKEFTIAEATEDKILSAAIPQTN